jgi:putative membrane protein
MWILQRLFVVLAIAVVLLFGMLNAGEIVQVKYWFGATNTIDSAPLPLVMVAFFLVGVLFYYLFSIAREWRLRAEIRRLRRMGQSREQELKDLRNIALEDDLDAIEPVADDEVIRT